MPKLKATAISYTKEFRECVQMNVLNIKITTGTLKKANAFFFVFILYITKDETNDLTRGFL